MTLAQSREDDDQGRRDGDPYAVKFWDLVMDEQRGRCQKLSLSF